jgi:hypothetical protein
VVVPILPKVVELVVDGVVADYDRQIHETVQAQQADDGMEVAS